MHSVAVSIVVVILTFLVGFRELLPKRIGLNHPEAIAAFFAMPMKMVSVVTASVYLVVNQYRVLLDILKIRPPLMVKLLKKKRLRLL
jgi:putative hemolysin